MLLKKSQADGTFHVTFHLPAEVGGTTVHLCGEFNAWSKTTLPMTRAGDEFHTTVHLKGGRTYRYRYLVDGRRWENDWAADDYVPNEFGGEDSAVVL